MSRRKSFPMKLFTLALACAAFAWGGYELSHYRAGMPSRVREVLAAAGGDGLLSRADGEGDARYRISSLSVFSNVALHVKDNYVDPERIEPSAMLRAALREIERQVAEVLVEDVGSGELVVKVLDQQKTVTVDDVKSLWEINLKLREVFRFFEKHLPPQDDLRVIEYAAINGALSTLDPHSVLLQPEAFAEMKTSTKGEFGGLGIVISVRDGKLTIVSPIDGTPADRAGLKSGDVVTRIGEVSTVSMAIEEAVQMLRGPEGSEVTIWVDRKGWSDPRKFIIVRERIKIESVEGELLSSNVGYIKIKNFQQNTGDDLERQLERLKREAGGKLGGLILDLRNNPGGLLEQAIRVSDKFLTAGDIVTTVGYGNQLREPKRARWSGTEAELPVAVLINKGSASASEIVAGALKNLNRAVLIGERSFGKGSVQVLYDFADSSALKLTIAQYLTPGGISIQSEGVVPDIALKPAWLDGDGVRVFYEPEGNRESNLDQHLERSRESKAPRESQPKFSMTYLANPPENEDEPEDPLDADYEVQFAKGFLLAAGHADRNTSLRAGATYVNGVQSEQETLLVERMKELGVDWTWQASDPSAVKVQAELTLASGTNEVEAGSEVEVVGRVTNVGTVPVHRVRGVLESEHPAFKGRELLFGALAPGETRTWTVKTQVPKDSEARSDVVDLVLSNDEGVLGEHPHLSVVTRPIPHPDFAYSYVLDDRKRGDGDGILERGEGIEMAVLVQNTGQGAADEVSVRLKSGAGENLFLERGRANVGELAAGQVKVAVLEFRVPESASDEPLPLELTIYDSGTSKWLEDELSLRAFEPNPAHEEVSREGWVKVTEPDTLMWSQAAEDAFVVATIEAETVLKAQAFDDRYVRVFPAEGAPAFLAASSIEWIDGKGKAPEPVLTAGVELQPARRPPVIRIQSSLGGKVVAQESARLTGLVSGRELRDMYVLLNGEKVFFKSGPQPPSLLSKAPDADAQGKNPNAVQAWTPPVDDAVKVPFSVDLQLKEGLNKVLVVARLDEKIVTYRSLFVSRRSQRPHVAETQSASGGGPGQPR